jgi:photosystem II stability/assembly factor-like uncharacterized protein
MSLLAAPMAGSQQNSASALPELRWRMIGPFRGGRVLPVTGIPGTLNEYLFGAVGGGVWKTTNGGNTWQPIFDAQPIASIGAIAVAPSDPKIIYVGSGEADMRSDISYGDGMYESTDGGATWANIGLRDSQQIGSILVDPRDPRVVLVAALGHAYGPNAERGVFRTTDGGASWQKVLSKNDDTGAIDLCSDPTNPQIVYASLWQVRRFPGSAYAPTSGPGSGLYKSSDGGANWAPVLGHGFPSENLGRTGIAIAPSEHGRRVYAIVDAREGGLYRSDDSGENWRRISSDARIWQRGWYFGGVTVDPRNPNVVYVMDTSLYRSVDGGEHFEAFKGAPGGDDYHMLWIAPDDPKRMILGSDQGVAISVDGGATWSSWFNQPTAQFYHVTTDNRFPYRVYGAQQDSGTAAVTSRSDYGQITFRDWSPVGGEESGYIAISSAEPNIVYGGGPYGVVTRFDWTTAQSLDVSPWPRFTFGDTNRSTWTSPLVFSPQNQRRLYFGTQFVLASESGGLDWKTISPDLTKRNTVDRSGKTSEKSQDRAVIYTIAPSPAREHQLWVGTDNGLIQLSTDDGAHWTNLTPPNIAEWSKISLIEGSHWDAGEAYAAVDRHEMDDYLPYIYRTRDLGKTWQNVAAGIPAGAYVNAVREDWARKGLLFAGTELGVYFSIDDGDHWQSLQLNLPVSSIRDLAIHGDDLVVATHGRAFWILDDIEPLREWGGAMDSRDAYLYHPAKAIRIRRSENRDTPLPPETPVGSNPPAGAIIDYDLPPQVTGEVSLEIRDKQGNIVRRYSSNDVAPEPDNAAEFPKYWLPKFVPLSSAPGFHRFVWDLRYASPSVNHHEYSMAAIIGGGTVTEPQGPLVLPGEYEIWLTAGGHPQKQSLTVEMDPRVAVPLYDLKKQLELALAISADIAKATQVDREITDVRRQVKILIAEVSKRRGRDEIALDLKRIESAASKMQGSQGEFPAPPSGLMAFGQALSAIVATIDTADSAPTVQAQNAFEPSAKQLSEFVAKWDLLKSQDIGTLNQRLRKEKVAEIRVSGTENK